MRKLAIALVFFTLSAAAQVTPKTVHFMSDDGKTKLTGYLWLPNGRGPHPAVVMMHGRHGAYSSLAHGVYDAHTLTKRHKMWGEFWAERGYVALHVDGFGPRGYPAGFAKGTYSDRPEELNEVTIRPFDAYGALRYLRTRNEVVGDRIGLQGWSNGASATLSTMARNTPGMQDPTVETGFRAAIAFYPGCGLQDHYKKAYRTYAPVLLAIGTDDEEVSLRYAMPSMKRASVMETESSLCCTPARNMILTIPAARSKAFPPTAKPRKTQCAGRKHFLRATLSSEVDALVCLNAVLRPAAARTGSDLEFSATMAAALVSTATGEQDLT